MVSKVVLSTLASLVVLSGCVSNQPSFEERAGEINIRKLENMYAEHPSPQLAKQLCMQRAKQELYAGYREDIPAKTAMAAAGGGLGILAGIIPVGGAAIGMAAGTVGVPLLVGAKGMEGDRTTQYQEAVLKCMEMPDY